MWNKIIWRTKSHCTAGWYFFWVAIGYPASWNFLKGASTHGIAMAVSVILKPTLERSWEHCFHSEAPKNWGWCLWCVFACDVPNQKPQILSFARKDFGICCFPFPSPHLAIFMGAKSEVSWICLGPTIWEPDRHPLQQKAAKAPRSLQGWCNRVQPIASQKKASSYVVAKSSLKGYHRMEEVNPGLRRVNANLSTNKLRTE